jgi:hypothetical protein
MRTCILFVVVGLLVASSAFAAMFNDNLTATAESGNSPIGSGDFHFYYYGEPTWQWTIPSGGFTGVDFDPTDNMGDTHGGSYEVVYVDSLWNYVPDIPYDTTLYICPDDAGLPDFDNPLYTYGPYEPDYYAAWDSQEIDPPIQFGGGEIFWVLYAIDPEYGHPISDADGNSGHSWLSIDGIDWELMMDQGGIDWCQGVYANEVEVENIATESFGGIKALYK